MSAREPVLDGGGVALLAAGAPEPLQSRVAAALHAAGMTPVSVDPRAWHTHPGPAVVVGATAVLEAPLLAPCVLVVPDAADPEARLALPVSLAPFVAVVAETAAQARAIRAVRHCSTLSLDEIGPGEWRELLDPHRQPPAEEEREPEPIEVHGTDVTPRVERVTRTRDPHAPTAPARADHFVSIVMLSWDQPQFTERCIASVRRHTRPPYEIILVDNASTSETRERVRALPDVWIENERNEGFARGNNQGLARARGDITVILNNDTEVHAGWLDGPLALAEDRAVALVAPAVSDAGGWISVRTRPTGVVREILPFTEPPPAVCYVARTEVLRQLQGFSEIYPLGSGEDVDLCFKAWWEGLRVLVDERNVIHHEHGGSTRPKLEGRRRELWASNRRLFLETWQARGREHVRHMIDEAKMATEGEHGPSFLQQESKRWELPRDLLYERRLYARYIAELSLQIEQLAQKRELDLQNIARDREKFQRRLKEVEEARRGPRDPDAEQAREIGELRARWAKRLARLERQVLLARSLGGVLIVLVAALLCARAWPGIAGPGLWIAAGLIGLAALAAGHFAWQRKRRKLAAS